MIDNTNRINWISKTGYYTQSGNPVQKDKIMSVDIDTAEKLLTFCSENYFIFNTSMEVFSRLLDKLIENGYEDDARFKLLIATARSVRQELASFVVENIEFGEQLTGEKLTE